MDWEAYSWVMRSRQRQEIVRLLQRPRIPSQLADELDTHLSQVSHSLSQFQKRGLVECITPDARKGRLYRLTEKGENVWNEMGD